MVLFFPDLVLMVKCVYGGSIWSWICEKPRRASVATINKTFKLISPDAGNHLWSPEHKIVLGELDRSCENVCVAGDMLCGRLINYCWVYGILPWVLILIQVFFLIIWVYLWLICIRLCITAAACHSSNLLWYQVKFCSKLLLYGKLAQITNLSLKVKLDNNNTSSRLFIYRGERQKTASTEGSKVIEQITNSWTQPIILSF